MVAERCLCICSGCSLVLLSAGSPAPGFPWKNSRALHKPNILWFLEYCFFLLVSFSSPATHVMPSLCSAQGICSRLQQLKLWLSAAPDEPAQFPSDKLISLMHLLSPLPYLCFPSNILGYMLSPSRLIFKCFLSYSFS